MACHILVLFVVLSTE